MGHSAVAMSDESDRIRRIMREVAEEVGDAFADSIRAAAVNDAPIESGELRGSSGGPDGPDEPLGPDRSVGHRYEWEIWFHAGHAAVQHENLDFDHPDRPGVTNGKAKFLEDQIKAHAPRLEIALTNELNRRLRAGGFQ